MKGDRGKKWTEGADAKKRPWRKSKPPLKSSEISHLEKSEKEFGGI